MARQLWLLRHGDAEPHGTRADSERRLHRARRGAGAVRRPRAARPRRPARARLHEPEGSRADTALLACEALGVEPVEHKPLTSGFDAAEALQLAESDDDGDGRVVVVGHEPDFSQVVFDLTGARIDMKKGGIAGVRLDGARGELIVLLRPRELQAMR